MPEKPHVETTQQDQSKVEKEAAKKKISPSQGLNDDGGGSNAAGQQSGQGQGQSGGEDKKS